MFEYAPTEMAAGLGLTFTRRADLNRAADLSRLADLNPGDDLGPGAR
ncbi:MAG TPA: hypothetical protein VKS82_01455 [Streptosporangiaceae bacterium]|nr:hypothetical protein [Streptosporangiaceae bacterium]